MYSSVGAAAAATAVSDGGGDENVHKLTFSVLRRCFIALGANYASGRTKNAEA